MEKRNSNYTVMISKKAKKLVKKMPIEIQDIFTLLIEDIKKNGAMRTNWQNFSDLGKGKYHCHLKYHWVACWTWKKGTFVVEVYYAGSRENAPY
ncbi:MAG: hypothetical protein J6I73_06220 [Treponema sp.]|nr:hypothetical protein [Treponema sp.]